MEEKEELKASAGLKVICFLIPLVGLIIYACNVSHNRKYANSCGIASIIGVILPIIISLIIGAFIFISNTMAEIDYKKREEKASEEYEEHEKIFDEETANAQAYIDALIKNMNY